MKKAKIIVPAMGLLLLGTAASVTSTVAWFSANNKVTVNGMKVSTQVKGNLLIANSNSADTNYSSENLGLDVGGVLEPVSTVNGVNFFYTKENVSGTGATTDTALETYSTQSLFEDYYDIDGADAYAEYAFYLKATSDVANQNVVISKFNMLYNGAAMGSEKAWRVAVFSQTVTETVAGTTPVAGDLKTILTPDTPANSAGLYFTSGNAWSANNAKGSVSSLGSAATIGTIAAKGTTQRFYVVVRLFLEGEDKTCKNDTFANLTEDYTLNLVCELGNTATGATQLVSQQAAVATAGSGNTASVVAGALGDDLVAYQWEKKAGSTWNIISGQTTDSLAAQTAGDVVRCKVTTQNYGIYYSNPVTCAA